MIDVLFNGILLGVLYTLLALGLSLAFGMMRIVNFAHGEFFTVGMFAAITAGDVFSTTTAFVVALVAAPFAGAAIAVVMDATVLRRIYDRDELATLLATWGFALILQQLYRHIWGSQPQSFTYPLSGTISVAGIQYPTYRVLAIGIGVVATIGFFLFFNRSSLGLKAQATIQDRSTASAMGIDTQQTTRSIFVVGAAIAAFSGVLFAPIGAASPTIGRTFIVLSFMIVIMGGLGSITGTVIASFVVGFIDSITSVLYSSVYAEAAIFGAVLVIMLLRPGGIAGVDA